MTSISAAAAALQLKLTNGARSAALTFDPEWIGDVYQHTTLQEACSFIVENPDIEQEDLDLAFETAGVEDLDHLLQWLGSDRRRVTYVDTAMAEVECPTLEEALQGGQRVERREIMVMLMRALENGA